MPKPFTVCVLMYGDHPDLSDRVLRSLYYSLQLGSPLIDSIRLGLNEVSAASRQVIDWFVEHASKYFRVTVITYDCPANASKYPLMRRMLLEDPVPLSEHIVWFDDDSYLDGTVNDFWSKLLVQADSCNGMVGKIYTQGMSPTQWNWIVRQPWFNAKIGKPSVDRRFANRPAFRFCTGGWWSIRSEILIRHDWPTRELILIGGDSMLGELCRHQGYALRDYCEGVRVNANEKGQHSKAAPRGDSPRPKLRGSVMLGIAKLEDINKHHQFICSRLRHS